MKNIIHYCNYASQPDIQIACDNSWGIPDWKDGIIKEADSNGEGGIYKLDDGRLYTFTKKSVTCPDCMIIFIP